jgi:hypothetical protein
MSSNSRYQAWDIVSRGNQPRPAQEVEVVQVKVSSLEQQRLEQVEQVDEGSLHVDSHEEQPERLEESRRVEEEVPR